MNCPYHGYSTPCPTCRKEGIAYDRERAKAGTWVYAIFAHRGDGRYRLEDAVSKGYQRQSAAEKQAEKLNQTPNPAAPRGFVVRFVPNPTKGVDDGSHQAS